MTAELNHFSTNFSSLALFVALIGLYAVQVLYLMVLNKKHSKSRQRMGKQAILVDKSMQRIKHISSTAVEDGNDADGQKAFDDQTDWQNEDFIYVY